MNNDEQLAESLKTEQSQDRRAALGALAKLGIAAPLTVVLLRPHALRADDEGPCTEDCSIFF